MKNLLTSVSGALVLTFAADAARAADYYVAPNGTANAAGTMAAPWTFARAVGSTGAGPGDTVYVRGGTYNGAVNFTRSGSAASWITFRAYPGELPIIQGTSGSGVSSSTAQYVRFIGIAVRNFTSSGFGNGWVNDTGTSNGNLQFINCIADNNGINGIAFYNATGLLIENSIVAHNGNGSPSQSWSSGVNLFHVMGGATANIVRGNVSFENIDISSHHSDGSGYILDQNSDGAAFINNIGFHNGGSCIRLTNSPGALIVNNTCWHNGLDPTTAMGQPANPGEIYFSNPNTMQVVAFANNLGAARGYNNTQSAWGGQVPTGAANQNNYAVNANGATPFWMNPAALDFRLVAGMTQAIDKGTTSNAPANDIGFDGRCITTGAPAAVSGQQAPPSWWTYSIDYAYIQSIGGIGACFRPGTRTGTPDIGAFEYGTAVTGTGGTGGGTGGAGGSGGPIIGAAGSSGTGAGGSGGSAGSGGSGNTGISGSTGTGTAGRGGATGSGGTTGSGGSVNTGAAGVTGTGTAGRGGTTGSGGSVNTGAAGTTVVTGAAGSGAGGTTGAGGSVNTGAAGVTGTGTAGSGVVSGAGGSVSTGAAGSAATGQAGVSGTGVGGSGASGSGGSSSSGAGGQITTGAGGATGTGSGGDGPGQDAAGGCACRYGDAGSTGSAALVIFGVALLGRTRRRRR